MDYFEFRKYIKKSGKKPHVVEQLIQQVESFETFLGEKRQTGLDKADEADLNAFIASLEAIKPGSASKRIRGLVLYFRFIENSQLADLASNFRKQEIDKGHSSFRLKDFRGVDQGAIQKLKSMNIITIAQMLLAGKTPLDRQRLAEKSGLSPQVILELVKLSDLARLPGLKQIRARLYYDAGIDTVEKMANLEPEEILNITAKFIERTGFEGITPLPKEVHSGIRTARSLPKIIEY